MITVRSAAPQASALPPAALSPEVAASPSTTSREASAEAKSLAAQSRNGLPLGLTGGAHPQLQAQAEAQLQSKIRATADVAASLEAKLQAHVPGEILVRMSSDSASLGSIRNILQAHGAEDFVRLDFPGNTLQKSQQAPVMLVKLREDVSVAQALAMLDGHPDLSYAVPNHVYTLNEVEDDSNESVPNDLSRELWGLHNEGQTGGTTDADIDAPEAWEVTKGSKDGPLIAILDTGIDYEHEDLAGNTWTNPGEIPGDGIDNDGNGVIDDVHGYNPNAGTGDPMDGHSHGTHVAGTIGAEGDNGTGVVGVNQKARMMGVKIFSDGGRTSAAAIISGINYSTRMGARITSNSWGGGPYNQAIKDAFAESPALHVIAAGNAGRNVDRSPNYPSGYELDNIISVAATDHNDELASFSNYGKETVDVAAPGVRTYSTTPGDGYANKSGTSMATPHVSGVAALVLTAYPDATNAEVKARIMGGADRIDALADKVASGGRLNAANALENDSVAPSAVGGLTLDNVSARGAQVRFTAPGDDGMDGQAQSYIVKISDRPIVDGPASAGEVSFEDAKTISVSAPQTSGSEEAFSLDVRPSGSDRPLYVAIKAVDNVGNVSEMAAAQATLPAANVAFEDDMNSGGNNWEAQGTWGRVDEAGRGKVWTDSPSGDYRDNADSALTSKVISLKDFSKSALMFDLAHDIESGYDHLKVEVSVAGSGQWTKVAEFTGTADWDSPMVDLSAFDGQDIQVRFRMESDGSITADGAYIDNVVVVGG